MGWQRRGTGYSYNSLTGHSSLIGAMSGKVLAVQVMSSESCNKETCCKNHSGSAKSMEPAAALLMLKSEPLKEADVKVEVLVGDADSSTAAAVRAEFGDSVERALDIQHAKKNFKNNLYLLQKVHKNMTKPVIMYLTATVGTVISKHKGYPIELKAALYNIPEHVFNKHEKCSPDWCRYHTDPHNYKSKYLAKSLGEHGGSLYNDICTCIEKLARKSDELSVGGSTQPCESFNNTVSSKAPKNKHYGGSQSLKFRVKAAVLHKNEGVDYTLQVLKEMELSPGKMNKKLKGQLKRKRLRDSRRKTEPQCLTVDTRRELCRQSHNWRIGKYCETVYRFCHVRQKTRFMPWLWLEADKLWLSKGNVIEAYIRQKHGHLSGRPLVRLQLNSKEDFSRFVIKDGLLVSGGRDGGVYGWDAVTHDKIFSLPTSHQADVHDVDVCQNIVLTASRDRTVKVWQVEEQGALNLRTTSVGDRVLCVAADSELWCCGSSGVRLQDTLQVFDLNSGEQVASLGREVARRPGAGLLDLAWETPQLILSCGYDASLKMWDLRYAVLSSMRHVSLTSIFCCRVSKCVAHWDDPHDTTLYCLASDGAHSVLCGSSRHSRVQLWDKRQAKGVQMYFATSHDSSPVYSLTFDPGSMFLALDQSLNCLDFTTWDAAIHNFNLHA
ncbi:hypothetical protein B566_EDAN007662 [Ephemera danica]|nr:hypothetical protein B566_EDAN007662 [Ephemera danica]